MTNGRTRIILNGRLRDTNAAVIEDLKAQIKAATRLIGEIDGFVAKGMNHADTTEALALRRALQRQLEDAKSDLEAYEAQV